jgi:Kef-type K+ transport system membrane component KefB
MTMLLHVLLALATVVALARACGRLARRVGQPAVVGEMLAGIVLGPSLLGHLAPGASAFLVPGEVVPHLHVVAQIGIALYMFVVGLQFDVTAIGRRTRAATFVSLSGIAIPLLLGGALGAAIFPVLAPAAVTRSAFVPFFAVAMSMTAFPVLARLVADRGLQGTPLGVMALTCAALGDAIAWCLLAVVVGIASRRPGAGLATLGLTAAYVAVLLGVARPLLRRLARREERRATLAPATIASVLFALLLSSVTAEWVGLHALFGAFLVGAIVPAEGLLARRLTARLEAPVSALLLPVFFASVGLRTELGRLSGSQAWLLCALVVSVAFVGKLGGTLVAARLSGMGWRRAASLGALMNTRGLMELVVLNVGLDLGVVSAPLFTMMVVMALATTVAAGPLLSWLAPARGIAAGATCSERCWCADSSAPAT